MNRIEAKSKLICIFINTPSLYLTTEDMNNFIDDIYNSFEKDVESIKKENTRLKKQLSKGHHIECSCSFCKPVDNQLKEDLEDYNKMVKVGINAK